jgi:hypothetical protein
MAVSVQGWRTKWFYIKDRKVSSSDEYGLAPFDASQDLKKLSSWDSPPTDVEMEEIAPLLTRIQALKGGRGGALSGTQLMAFFVEFNPTLTKDHEIAELAANHFDSEHPLPAVCSLCTSTFCLFIFLLLLVCLS